MCQGDGPSICVCFGSGLIFIVGLLTTGLAVLAPSSGGFVVAADLIQVDSDGTVNLRVLLYLASALSASSGFLSLGGCVGAVNRSRCCLCSFCFCSTLLALVLVAASAVSASILATAGPELQRQAANFCDSSASSALVARLGCNLTKAAITNGYSSVSQKEIGRLLTLRSLGEDSLQPPILSGKIYPDDSLRDTDDRSFSTMSGRNWAGNIPSGTVIGISDQQGVQGTNGQGGSIVAKCIDTCGQWADFLQRTPRGGCQTLAQLCTQRAYVPLLGACPPAEASSLRTFSTNSQVLGADQCRSACSLTANCGLAMVSASGFCKLFEGFDVADDWFPSPLGVALYGSASGVSLWRRAFNTTMGQFLQSDKSTTASAHKSKLLRRHGRCYRRSVTLVVARFSQVLTVAMVCALLLAVLLLQGACCACGLIYQESPARDIRRGFWGMCCAVCCPYLGPNPISGKDYDELELSEGEQQAFNQAYAEDFRGGGHEHTPLE